MIDVPITMNKIIEPGSEIYACVIQLGSSSFSQSIKCNITYASPTASGEPQTIIVPLYTINFKKNKRLRELLMSFVIVLV